MRGNRSRKIFKNSFVPIIVLILFGTISIVDAQCSAGQQVLKSAPFTAKNEDWISFIVVAVLVLDTLAGFSLIMDQGRTIKVFNSDNMGMGLIVLNVSCLILQVVVAIVVEWKLYKKCNTREKVYSKCCCCIVSKRKGNEKSKSKCETLINILYIFIFF